MSSIGIFLSDLDGGGAERVMLNLAGGFVEQGLEVDLVLVKAEGSLLSEVHPKVRVVNLGCQRLLLSIPAMIRYLQQQQPTALLSALEDTNLVALWARQLAGVSTRIVVSVHNNLSQESQQATELKRRLTPYLVSWFYPWADKIITVSQGVAQDLVKMGLSSERIQVIYNPIITPEYCQKILAPLNHPWFSPSEPPVILGVGRLHKQKDFPSLIQAFALVQQMIPARLMILGEGKERQHLEALVQKLGLNEKVALPGFVANPYIYMRHAAVLVLSSAWEGFGNVLVEAMAAGTPVVSTNCESGPAEILSNGQYGKLVDVGDIQGMAKAIVDTIEQPKDSVTLGRRASEFSLDKALAQYWQVLQIDLLN